MEISLLKGKMILELEKEIQQGNYEVLQEFWDVMEVKGSPLIEELEGDLKNDLVTFVYKAENDLENVVFIPPVGMRNLLENKMERLLETDLWYITYKAENDIRFSYCFSPNDSFDDDWEKRQDNLVHDRFNNNIQVFKGEKDKKDILRSYVVMPKAKDHVWIKERKDAPKGILHEHNFHSENLEKCRRVRIYTPYEYDKDNEPYGYLVLNDGDEYINKLSATTVLDNLIADKKIPPIVTIFIDSTETRMKELRCSDTFGDVIVKELIPWIRDRYNISNKADEAVIGGLSLGGLTASYLGLKYYSTFGNVLSQSGSYWYKPESYEGAESDCWLSTQFEAIDKLPFKFYLNVGILETKDRMIDTNIKLRDVLIEKGYTVDFEYFNSGHDYLCWGETLANGLISLIGIK
jgi:enterochelin esterase family protein